VACRPSASTTRPTAAAGRRLRLHDGARRAPARPGAGRRRRDRPGPTPRRDPPVRGARPRRGSTPGDGSVPLPLSGVGAPFDRVLVGYESDDISAVWVHHVRPGGRLLARLAGGPGGGGHVLFRRSPTETAPSTESPQLVGRFLGRTGPLPARRMAATRRAVRRPAPPTGGLVASGSTPVSPTLLANDDSPLVLLAQLHLPRGTTRASRSTETGAAATYLQAPDGLVGGDRARVRPARPLRTRERQARPRWYARSPRPRPCTTTSGARNGQTSASPLPRRAPTSGITTPTQASGGPGHNLGREHGHLTRAHGPHVVRETEDAGRWSTSFVVGGRRRALHVAASRRRRVGRNQ
jgi:hypothetical protein